MTLRTVSGWEHSSTKQFERVPRGSFEVATCKYTVSASIIDRNRAVIDIYATSFTLVAFLFRLTRNFVALGGKSLYKATTRCLQVHLFDMLSN